MRNALLQAPTPRPPPHSTRHGPSVGVSRRSSWSGAPGPWCWWCRCVLSPVFWDGLPGRDQIWVTRQCL